ncbi:MAG: hypothetical protein ABI559_08480 [Chloroflexota bacterium]
MKKWFLLAPILLALGVFANQGSAFAGNSSATVCNGDLVAGNYVRVIVPEGAFCFSEGYVNIKKGVLVREGGTFVLGSEDNPVPTGFINGGVVGLNAASVQIHFTRISGGINLQGGFGPFGPPFDVTWNTIEDSTIHGNVSITNYDGFWQGFFRNKVYGNVTFNNNQVVDTDGNEVQTNAIHGSISCQNNFPAPQSGDSGGHSNVIDGFHKYQCASIDSNKTPEGQGD